MINIVRLEMTRTTMILECILMVLKGVCSQETISQRLEPLLLPLVLKILGDDGDFIEYLECGLDILTFLMYFQAQLLSMELWQWMMLLYPQKHAQKLVGFTTELKSQHHYRKKLE